MLKKKMYHSANKKINNKLFRAASQNKQRDITDPKAFLCLYLSLLSLKSKRKRITEKDNFTFPRYIIGIFTSQKSICYYAKCYFYQRQKTRFIDFVSKTKE